MTGAMVLPLTLAVGGLLALLFAALEHRNWGGGKDLLSIGIAMLCFAVSLLVLNVGTDAVVDFLDLVP